MDFRSISPSAVPAGSGKVAAFGCRKSGPRHPFRAKLPAHVRAPLPVLEPEVAAAIERRKLRSDPVDWQRLTLQDAKDFLLAYCACFVALMAFIA
ncbi:hypothetical protein [Novosphingobium sp.]|uniref:hypothetical protein n=1 Tax=Novosphingobium sp. TaxID=1874826 RepID=UPI0038B75E01